MNFLDLAQETKSAENTSSTQKQEDTSATPQSTGFGIELDDFAQQQATLLEQKQKKEAEESAKKAALLAEQEKQQAAASLVSVRATSTDDQEPVSFQDINSVYLVLFRGEFDETNVDKAFEKVEKRIGKLEKRLAVFDLKNVRYVNSKYMGYLANWYQRFSDVEGELVISHGGKVLDSLEACGISSLIRILPTAEQAVMTLFSTYPQYKSPTTSSVVSAPIGTPVAVSPVAHATATGESAVAGESLSSIKIETVSPIVTPAGIRDSEGKTFVFHEKEVKHSSVEALAKKETVAAPSAVIPVTQEEVSPLADEVVHEVLQTSRKKGNMPFIAAATLAAAGGVAYYFFGSPALTADISQKTAPSPVIEQKIEQKTDTTTTPPSRPRMRRPRTPSPDGQ